MIDRTALLSTRDRIAPPQKSTACSTARSHIEEASEKSRGRESLTEFKDPSHPHLQPPLYPEDFNEPIDSSDSNEPVYPEASEYKYNAQYYRSKTKQSAVRQQHKHELGNVNRTHRNKTASWRRNKTAVYRRCTK